MLLYIGWVAAIIVVIVRACIGCSRRQRHPQAGVVLKSRRKKMARRGSALQASGLVTVTSTPPRDTRAFGGGGVGGCHVVVVGSRVCVCVWYRSSARVSRRTGEGVDATDGV